ncbi:MAG TPA: hypothetical protein EYH22_01305 [Candidatus Nanopusillus sp.]|nr:hypothetical protein [Candidatus Nanopusillus sp.]
MKYAKFIVLIVLMFIIGIVYLLYGKFTDTYFIDTHKLHIKYVAINTYNVKDEAIRLLDKQYMDYSIILYDTDEYPILDNRTIEVYNKFRRKYKIKFLVKHNWYFTDKKCEYSGTYYGRSQCFRLDFEYFKNFIDTYNLDLKNILFHIIVKEEWNIPKQYIVSLLNNITNYCTRKGFNCGFITDDMYLLDSEELYDAFNVICSNSDISCGVELIKTWESREKYEREISEKILRTDFDIICADIMTDLEGNALYLLKYANCVYEVIDKDDIYFLKEITKYTAFKVLSCTICIDIHPLFLPSS